MRSFGFLLLTAAAVVSNVRGAVIRDEAYQRDASSQITSCAISQCSAGTKFGYTVGQNYEYRYEADIKTSVPGSSEHSSLHVRATARLEAVAPCEMVLRLTDVTLQDSDPTRYESRQAVESQRVFKQSLEANPLRFSFIDGLIDSICPTGSDEVWTLNLKRGILSTLQNTMSAFQGVSEVRETDVMGNCPIRYEASSTNGNTVVRKVKTVLGCTERVSARTVFQSVGYEADSDVQAMPLVKGTHQCEQEINTRTKIINKVVCRESHQFVPFSSEGSGATSEITYNLTFSRQSDGNQAAPRTMTSRQSLLFDHTLSTAEIAGAVRDAQQTMTQLCQQTQSDVRPDVPKLFATLVKQLRKLDTRSLQQVMGAKPCPKATNFFGDALPVLGTPASVSVIRDVVTKGQVSEKQKKLLLTSLAFIKNPTKDMIKDLQAMLSFDFENSALPVTSTIHTYCKANEAEDPEVAAILRTLETELRYNCRIENDSQRDRMLLALRAIGNAGNAERQIPTLTRCVQNPDTPMLVRVTAIQAFRRISCSQGRAQILSLYENKQLDSELRINAYLAAMQCATRETIDKVRTVLQSEEVNQVGSFVWTHLTNLAETSCPLKNQIKSLVEDPKLLKEFDLDKRKFSRNFEISHFNELLNVGAAVESNIIWSASSYIPRSASANLTVDLFGRSVNLLEVGGRAQGLETIIERYLGPNSEIQREMKRDKRAVIRDEVISTMDRKFTKPADSTQLSYFLRVFGNELKAGDIFNLDFESMMNQYNYMDILTKLAQDKSIDYTRNMAFLDSTMVIPTGVGMPLKLGVEGTATIGLSVRGKFDIRRIMTSPTNFDISGSVKPSAALEIQGEFGVDATVTKTRLSVTNTMHTSTLLDGKLTLRDGQVFNAEWNMPQQKMEIFSAESHFYVTHRGQDREQNVQQPSAIQAKRCTDPTWSNKFGLELCGELAYPGKVPNRRVYPRTGPVVAKIYLNKLDTFSSAKFDASVVKGASVDTARLSFNTPGSRVDREVIVDYRMHKDDMELTLNLKSPWKKAAVTGKVVNQPEMKRATLKTIVDDRLEYSINAELATSEPKPGEVKYVPGVKVVLPGRDPIMIDGEVVYSRNKKVGGKIEIKNVFRTPVVAEGTVELQDNRRMKKYDATVQFHSPALKGSVTGFVTNANSAWASRADVNYQYNNGQKQRIVVNHKMRDASSENLSSYSTDGSWTTTMWPRYNGNFLFEEQFSPSSLRTKFDAGFDQTRRITIVQSAAFDVSTAEKKASGMLKFELPIQNMNYELKVDHVHNLDTIMLQTNASVKYNQNQEATLTTDIRKENTRYLSAVGQATLKLPGKPPMTLTNRITERQPREYLNEFNMAGLGKTLKATTTYKMATRHEFTTEVQATNQPPITIKGHLNPSLKNVQARAEVKYGPAEYAVDLSWLYRGAGNNFNTKAGLELVCKSRRYGASVDVSRRNLDFTTTLDANIGDNQKVTLSSQVSINPAAPRGELRIDWPGSFVSVMGSGKYETQSWMNSSNDLELAAKITSSYRGFEEMGGTMKIDVSPDSLRTSGDVTWAPGSKITTSFMYDRTRVAMNVTTPFNGYRSLKGEGTYMLRDTTLRTSGTAQWESSTISFNLDGTVNVPAFNVRVSFVSPFKNLEALSASIQNTQVNPTEYRTVGEVSWARGQKINLVSSMTHQPGHGLSLMNSGEATVTTPWRRYRTTKLTWNHQNDNGSMMKCHHELEFDSVKYILDLDGSGSRSRNGGIKWVGKGSVSWGPKTVTIEHEIDLQPYSTFVAKGKIMTPYQGYEMMGFDFDNRMNPQNNGFNSANVISLGDPRSKINLAGSLTFNGPTFNAAFRLTTPHEKIPRLTLNLRNARQPDGWWAAHGDLDYSPHGVIVVDGKLRMDQSYGVQAKITTPYQYLREGSVEVMANVRSPRSFTVTSELNHKASYVRDPNGMTIKFEGSVEATDPKQPRITLFLQTPFREISNAKLSFSHTYQSSENCVMSANYEFNDLRGQLTHRQTIKNAKNFNGRTQIEYITGKMITFEHNVATTSGSERIAVTASMSTPFSAVRDMSMNLNVDATMSSANFDYKFDAEMVLNRRDKITASGAYFFQSDNISSHCKSSIRITTPFQSLQRYVLDYDKMVTINTQRGIYSRNVKCLEEINNQKFAGQEEVYYSNGALRYNLTAETPYENYRTIVAKIEHGKRTGADGEGWANNARLELGSAVYTGESEWVWKAGQLQAKVVVNIPEEYSLVLRHKANPGDINCSLTMKAGPMMSGSSLLTMDRSGKIDYKASLDTQIAGYEKFEVTFKHEGSIANFRSSANLVMPFQDYRNFDAALTYMSRGREYKSTLQINTPFREMQRLKMSVDHTKLSDSRSDFDNTLNIAYNSKKITSTVSYKTDQPGKQLRASIITPYDGMQSTVLEINHRGDTWKSFQTSAKLTTSVSNYNEVTFLLENTSPGVNDIRVRAELGLPAGKSVLSLRHARGNDNLQCSLEITTPFQAMDKLTLSLDLHTENRQPHRKLMAALSSYSLTAEVVGNPTESLTVKAELRTNLKGLGLTTLTWNHNVIGENVNMNGKIETPKERIGVTISHNSVRRGSRSTTASIESSFSGYERFSFTMNQAGDISQFEVTGRVNTPFREAPQIDYVIRHRGNTPLDFQTSASAEWATGKAELAAGFTRARSGSQDESYTGNFRVACPCEKFSDFSISASHGRRGEVKTGSLAVILNTEKKVDMDYTYTTGPERSIQLNIRDPYPVSGNMNVGDSTGTGIVNWDTTDTSKKVRFDFSYKNIESPSNTERLFSFKTMVPQRTIGVGFGYTITPERFTNFGELLWNADPRPEIRYDITGARSLRRSMATYDGNFKLTSSILNLDLSANHKALGHKITTEIGLQSVEKLTIKSDVTYTTDFDFTHTLIAQHPKFKRDVTLTTEVKNGNSFTSSLLYDQQSVSLEGRLVDETRPGVMKHSGSLRLRHPNSMTDVQISGDAYSDYTKASVNVRTAYQTTRDRQMQNAALQAEINKLRDELSFELSSPLDTYKLTALNRNPGSPDDTIRYDITVSNRQASYKYSVDVGMRERSVNMKLYTSNDDYVQLFAQFYKPTESSFELTHFTRGQKVDDIKASLSKSEDRILSGYLYLRPDLLRDARTYYTQASRDPTAARYMGTMWERFSRTAQDEMYLKSRYLVESVQPIKDGVEYVGVEVDNKMAQLRSAFNNAYNRNEFYLRDIHQTLLRHADDVSRRMQYTVAEWKRGCQQISTEIRNRWNSFCYEVAETSREISNNIASRTAQLRMYTEQQLRPMTEQMMMMQQRLSRMEIGDIIQPIVSWIERMRMYMERSLAEMDGTMEQLLNSPNFIRTRETIFGFLLENKWMYQYLGLEDKVMEFIQKARATTWPMLREKVKQKAEEWFKWSRNRWVIWEPRRGEFKFEVYVPIDSPDIYMWRRYSLPVAVVSYIQDTATRYLPNDDWLLIETINAYKPSSDVRDWIPPFKSHASLTGAHHYLTFDRKFFDFAGECSYLLTRDFADKSFGVVVNYDRVVRGQPVKKSITVMTDGKQIEVFPDGKLSVDGRRVEMPVIVNQTSVVRDGNLIVIDNDKGMQVECDLPHDRCTVSVSGWYYGKLAGVLGTYDNEPTNDFTTIDNTVVDKPESVADSWTVGNKCRVMNRAVATAAQDENTRRFRACSTYFRDTTSPFRPCFRSVDPEPFLDMCLTDVPRDDNSLEAQEDVCRVAAAYVQECERKEVSIRQLSQCVKCEVPFTQDKFYDGEDKQFTSTTAPSAADVVILVQHAQCNKDIVEKVKDFVENMEKAMKAEGLKSIQYAVVGYGGKSRLSEPRVQTMDGQIFNTADKIQLALTNFDLESGSTPDAMAALSFVSRLPYRAGASKTVVLVPCDACLERTTRYSEIQRILLQSDIHLHMLIQELVRLKSKSPKTAFIYGVDESTVYTSKDVAGNELAGEPDLRKYIQLPKDLCVALAQDTEGSVFSARQWIDSRVVMQKKFVDVLVRSIARKAKPNECQVCECVPDGTGSGVSRCHPCVLRHLYNLMPNFNGADFSEQEDVNARNQVENKGPVPKSPPGGPRQPTTKKPRIAAPKKTAPPKKAPPKVQQE